MAGLGEKFSKHAQALGSASPMLSLGSQKPTLAEIPISQIEPDPNQPRRDLGDLLELSDSIRELGVIQPIIVTLVDFERFRILAGERRFAASKLADLVKVPAIVRSIEEHNRLELQLVENLHRKDLSPFEEAETYRRLLTDFRLTHEALGKRIGKTQVSVTETLKILDLPDRIRHEAMSGEGKKPVSKTILLEIARRPAGEQFRLWEEAKRGDLTVQKVRAVRAASGQSRGDAVPSRGKRFRHPVSLVKQKARVIIEFYGGMPESKEIISALEEALLIEKLKYESHNINAMRTI